MITSAGWLRRATSQGSPSRSAARRRPITSPKAVPSAIAITNEAATRASVTPRLKASAPERASAMIANATDCGSGRSRSPARCEPSHQAAISSPSEMSRSTTSIPRARPIEAAGIKLPARADQIGPADLGQDTIERARVQLLVGDRAARNGVAIALAIDRQRCRVGNADARRKPCPLVLRAGQNVLRFLRNREEAIDRRAVVRRPGTVEDIADDGHRSSGAE